MSKRNEPMFKKASTNKKNSTDDVSAGAVSSDASNTGEHESSTEKNASNTGEHVIAVSISLLYDGMVAQDDIYDSSGGRLLITSGNVLNAEQIERVKRLNSDHDTIYVTNRTHKFMLSKRPDIDIDKRQTIEEATGYTITRDNTLELLEEMASKKSLDMNTLRTVSDDLSSRLEETPQPVIISLINAMAPVDEYLQRHCINVGLLNGLIGRWIGLSEIDVDKLLLIGLLHDCGKTLLPPSILNLPRRLTAVEYEVIKKHADYTYDLLYEFPQQIRIASSSHHERLNGSGYGRRLSKDDIMFEARVTAISDTYDAMVSRRAYQTPQSPFSAMAVLEKFSGDLYDGDLVQIFLEHMPKEIMDKPVLMSDGTIGILRKYDPDDIEYPSVEINGIPIKTHKQLYCLCMHAVD